MVTGTIQPKIKGEEPKQFVLVKNCVGSITIVLEAHDFSVPARRISINYDQDRAYIMTRHALGVFVTPSALKQMEEGYFTFENLDTLIEMAEDRGYYVPDSIKEPHVSLKEIASILREGNEKHVKELIGKLNTKLAKDVATAARNLYPQLNQLTIKLLEDALQVSLAPVDLSE